MKTHKRPDDPLRALCAEVHDDDGTDPRLHRGPSREPRRDTSTRDLRFCGQVRRALQLSLSADVRDPAALDVQIDAVRPAPDCTRLLVLVRLHPGADPDTALTALGRAKPVLRGAIAQAINRKRTPELVFDLAAPDSIPSEEGVDE